MPNADAQSMLERLETGGWGDAARAIRRVLSMKIAVPPFKMEWSQGGITHLEVREGWSAWMHAVYDGEDDNEAVIRATRIDVPPVEDPEKRERRSFRCAREVWDAIPEPKATWVEQAIIDCLRQQGLLR